MDLFEAIENRYSYRGEFTEQQVSEVHLRKIVQAGLDAPSGKNLQTTQFLILNNQTIIAKVKDVLPEHKTMQTCSAIILCLVDKEPESFYHGIHFQIEDCAAAVENMLLAISALGYATVWLDGVLRLEKRAEKLSEILDIPAKKKVQIMLPIGVPVSEGPRKEKMNFDERACFNRYIL